MTRKDPSMFAVHRSLRRGTCAQWPVDMDLSKCGGTCQKTCVVAGNRDLSRLVRETVRVVRGTPSTWNRIVRRPVTRRQGRVKLLCAQAPAQRDLWRDAQEEVQKMRRAAAQIPCITHLTWTDVRVRANNKLPVQV